MKILITGIAGFIGFHLAKKLIAEGHEICGIDNLNNYYNPKLKEKRLELLGDAIIFHKIDCCDQTNLRKIITEFKPEVIVHLAAQAGVRYSLKKPFEYIDANIKAHLSILEAIKDTNKNIKLVYASSSSVYGKNTSTPYSETDIVDKPCSVYAASKRSCELFSETYAHLYGLKQIGLRFFTVYGTYGRPDMAYWIFTHNILHEKEIQLYENGSLERDFTHISDICDGINILLKNIKEKEDEIFIEKHEIYNIGNNNPMLVIDFLTKIENIIGKKAKTKINNMPLGDVKTTFADISKINKITKFTPKKDIDEGLREFISWYINADNDIL